MLIRMCTAATPGSFMRTGHFWHGGFGAVAMDENVSRRRCARVAQAGAGAPDATGTRLELVESARAFCAVGRTA